jgi:hypothetical protein
LGIPVTARVVLEGIKKQLAAATPGPWANGGRGYVETIPEFDLQRFDIMPETIARTELRDEDAVFIASAPSTVSRLTAALEAVLATADSMDRIADFNLSVLPSDDMGISLRQHAEDLRAAIENALRESQ